MLIYQCADKAGRRPGALPLLGNKIIEHAGGLRALLRLLLRDQVIEHPGAPRARLLLRGEHTRCDPVIERASGLRALWLLWLR